MPALRHARGPRRHQCTIEEREEYEPHIDSGFVVYAGVDYEEILREAEKEADVILWDGGNNDTPFYKPDLHIVVADPHRAGHELAYYPGETNIRLADVLIVNKVETARPEDVETVLAQHPAAQPGRDGGRSAARRSPSTSPSSSAASGCWWSRTARP